MKYKIILLAIIVILTSGCLGLMEDTSREEPETEDAPREEPELEYNPESNSIIVNEPGNVNELILEENGERIDYLQNIEKGNSLTLGLASKGSQLTLSSVYENRKRTIEKWQHPFGSIFPPEDDVSFKSQANPELNKFVNVTVYGYSDVPENLEIRLVVNGKTIDTIQKPENEKLDTSNIEDGKRYQIVSVLKSKIFENRKKIILEKSKADYSKSRPTSELKNEEKINRFKNTIEDLEKATQELDGQIDLYEEELQKTNDQEKIQKMQSEIEKIEKRKKEIKERKKRTSRTYRSTKK